jgi:apolipoprotein N-acyltransferase
MRAAETGRYLLRATNTGISAIIDARGRVVARTPQFETTVLAGEFRFHSGATPFVRAGGAPLLVALLAAAVLGFALARPGEPRR